MNNKKIYFIAGIACLSFFGLFLSWPALAAYEIEVKLPGAPSSFSDPGAYISYFFMFGLGLVGFLAVAAIVVGGIMYMTGGTIGKVERAKQIIWGAITGVVLLLCSYLLLYTIDPTLVNLSPFILPSSNIRQQQQQQQQQQQTAASCDPTTQVWSPSRGRCVAKPGGYGTAQCQAGSATCSESLCVPGGCAVATQQWNQGQCTCVALSSTF